MNKKTIIAIVVVAIIAVAVIAFTPFSPSQQTSGEEITVTLEISADGTSKTYDITTEVQTLGALLVEEGLVKNDRSDYGLYIQTVYGPFGNGRTADTGKEEWWCITRNGESVMTGADETKIAHGEKYELTLKVGYENF